MGKFWDAVKTVTTLGIADVIDSKDDRAAFMRDVLDKQLHFYKLLYEQQKSPDPRAGDGTKLDIQKFLNGLYDWQKDSEGYLSEPMYVWANQLQKVVFRGWDCERAMKSSIDKYGYAVECVVPDLSGKMDWEGILKAAAVTIASVVVGGLTGGPAGAVAGLGSGYTYAQNYNTGEDAKNTAKIFKPVVEKTVDMENVKSSLTAVENEKQSKQVLFFGGVIFLILLFFKPKKNKKL